MKGIYLFSIDTRFLLPPLLLVGFSVAVIAQNKQLEKANEAFKNAQYAQAADLYEQVLAELSAEGTSRKNTGTVKSKLAFCYRVNNKMDKAEALYADVISEGNVKPENYLYYGETLMSNGKYVEAKKWFEEYQRLEPDDEKGRLMIIACEKAPTIQPYFPFITIREFPHNSEADDNAPVAWQGGILFSSDRQSGLKLMKEKSGWTGRDYLDLYWSEKTADGDFLAPGQFSSKLSEVNKNTGNASLPADGSEIYFTRNDNVLNKQQTYTLQIYRAESAGEDRWKNVEKLSFCAPAYNFMHPAISPDGQWLYFTSNRAGGKGGADLWVAKRKGNDWEKPENLGDVINTSVNEGFPFVDANGRLYFCSKGHPGFGGFDIFMTERAENGNWKTPLNLGKPLNSPLDDISIYIAPDSKSGMFTSSRHGGDDDIYLFDVWDRMPDLQEPVAEEPEKKEVPEKLEPVVVEEKQPEPIEEVQPEKEVALEIPETKEEPAPVLPIEIRQPEPEKKTEPVVVKPEEKSIEAEQPDSPPSSFSKEDPEKPAELVLEELPVESEELFVDKTEAGIKNTSKIIEIQPVTTASANSAIEESESYQVLSFSQLKQKALNNELVSGQRFRLDGALFDAGVWQLTPRVAIALDKLAAVLKEAPSLQIELTSHTEALGIDEDNLRLSQNRADLAMQYLLREGIAANRIVAKGYGEKQPLNHCRNGVTCSMEEHLLNQRLEVTIK
jgi:outer membrane protein OmpA-like peptidoglycan-associated protein/tetratricopeptide (TPR) repeat protein